MSDAVRPDWSGRFRALRQINKHDRLDALVVSTPANLRYLTGFAGSAGLLVLTDDAGWLVVDGRYTGVVSEGIAAGELASVRLEKVEQRVDQTLAGLLHRVGVKRIGFEAAHVTVATLRSWQGLTSGVEWLPRASRRAPPCREGSPSWTCCAARRSGSEVARHLAGGGCRPQRAGRRAGHRRGARSRRFFRAGISTIVASGPNSAHPHARPTDRRLADGDLVVLDWRRVRRILRRPDANGRGRSGQRPGAGSLFAAVHEAQDRRDRDRARRRHRRGSRRGRRVALGSTRPGRCVPPQHGSRPGPEVHEAPRLSLERSAQRRCWRPGWSARSNQGRTRRVRQRRLEDDVLDG